MPTMCAPENTGLPGKRLKLELTESAIIADPDRMTEVLMALKALGPTIAMIRHRRSQPRLAPDAADRRAEDRPELRHRPQRPRQGGDRARDPEPGDGAGHGDRGGGDRDRRGRPDAVGARLHLRSGLGLARQAARSRGGLRVSQLERNAWLRASAKAGAGRGRSSSPSRCSGLSRHPLIRAPIGHGICGTAGPRHEAGVTEC
ncbi:hypothetical protein AB5I41_24115 [Sphingomonas sp. MMS24-JH45]